MDLTPNEISDISSKMIKTNKNEFDFDLEHDCSKLFESTSICNLKIKNYFCFQNLTDNFLFNTLGEPTEKFVSFYENITKSDVGLIFTGGVYVGEEPKKNIKIKPKMADLTASKNIFSKVTDVVHTNGSKIFLSVKTIFGRSDNKNKFMKIFPLSASNIKDYNNSKMTCMRISDGKCNQIVSEIGEVSKCAVECGFDGLLIDGNAFGLVGEFSSLEFNKRKFGYYSEIYDFAIKIVNSIMKETKQQVIFFNLTIATLIQYIYRKNANFIKTIKNLGKKQTKNEFFELIVKLVGAGVDGFVFEMGTFETEFLKTFNGFQKEMLYESFSAEIRDFFNKSNLKTKFGMPVVLIIKDNFNTPKLIKDAILKKETDFVDVTKNIYSDINFLNCIKTQKKFKNCIKCSKCEYFSQYYDYIDCCVNPSLSFDKLLKSTFYQNNKVAVVGGGISGINVAITLAERGFFVDLFERNDKLNKSGRKCEIFEYDELLKNYNDFIENRLYELEKNKKVNIHLSTQFDSKNADINSFYSIIVATGYHERFFEVSGAVLKNVKSIYDILGDEKTLYNKNSIVINAKSELSLKLAIYLLTQNKKVTLIIQSAEFLLKIPNDRLTYYLHVLKKLRAKVFVFSRVKFIQEDFVEIYSNNKIKNEDFQSIILNLKSGNHYSFEAKAKIIDLDLFIYEPDIYPNNKLYYELVHEHYQGELYLIGNALQIQDLSEDIRTSYYVGKNL